MLAAILCAFWVEKQRRQVRMNLPPYLNYKVDGLVNNRLWSSAFYFVFPGFQRPITGPNHLFRRI